MKLCYCILLLFTKLQSCGASNPVRTMADVSVDLTNKNSTELVAQGIRAYILQNYSVAVQALSRATELLVQEHTDDLHESLAEVYLYYGKSLLALARSESDALGDAVPKNEQDGDDDDTEGGDEELEKEGEDGNEQLENGENEKKDEDVRVEENGVAGPSGDNEDEKTDEEPTDLQVAWEVLELAKKIFERKGEDGKKFLADTLIVLGEISLESENFESAVNDMKQGLEIQKAIYSSDSRTIAESFYKLGITYATNTQIEEAVDCFKKSLDYLNNRINVLEKAEDKKDSVQEEIDEIKGLIPDIEEKIADMKNYKEETYKNLAELLFSTQLEDTKSSANQVNDISHLVKRKPKEN
ncbi:protein HGV2 isoform X2 [Aethina tumida]|uniref:protein HGV2 isoform X2 n=1 Tax=Aethina tumida TaxID=116153 RepID=UPI0021490ACD|nr:protein HGV2 isoform X2 [Aethina tumida]